MSWDFVTTNKVKCRSIHNCYWCGDRIDFGDSAIYYTGKWDGEFNNYYLHPECEEASKKLPSDDSEYGYADFKRGSTEAR